MSAEESLHDVNIREKQLQSHILSSPEYLHKADQELKRQVTMLYLAIALLLVFHGLFTFRATGLPLAGVLLMTVTSILAILNCLLLIRTKTWLRKLNEAWLAPQERVALRTIRSQRTELLTRIAQPSGDFSNAALN
jgi:Flp pilus assembly protein TadB